MSGYLDDYGASQGGSNGGGSGSGTGTGTTSSALLAHLQQQSYSRRIPPTGPSVHDEDDDDGIDDELSITTWDSEEEARKAQEEWEESLKQLNLAIQVMILPFFGKWLGRKWSYWAFSRFQQHGLGASFFGISWLWTPTTIIPGSAVAALQP